MRKIAYILAAVVLSACVSQKDKDKAFITDFYNHVLGIEQMTDEYLKASLSKELLDSLWETEYDDCYSYWDFRTGYQDGPSDISEVQARVTASVTGICRVTGKEVCEVINAMYDGDMRRARISEIGTYSGIPYNVAASESGLPAAEEAIYVQLATHKTTTGQSLSDPSAYLVHRSSFENGSTVII